MTRLLMVQPYKQLVQKAIAAGFTVHSIWDPRAQSAGYLGGVAALSASYTEADFDDHAELRRIVSAVAWRHGVDHVLHLGAEATMQPVVAAAEALKLGVNPAAAVHRLNDKAALRALLAEHGLSPVRSRVSSPDGVAAALSGFDLPVVVKPTELAGSRGVQLVSSAADLGPWRADLAARGYTGPVLVEEYLRGPEFSVETLSVDGRHHVIGVTAKQLGPPPGFVEVGHVHPAPLPAADRAAIVALVTAVLDATGYRFGPAHTEVILTAAGPRIVESQARLGGDRIPSLIRTASGFDIEAAIFTALAGQPVVPPTPERTAAISFLRLPVGRLESLDGVEEVRALPYVRELTVKYGPGDVVPATVDSSTRHGFVLVAAADAAQAADRLAHASGLLRATAGALEGATR